MKTDKWSDAIEDAYQRWLMSLKYNDAFNSQWFMFFIENCENDEKNRPSSSDVFERMQKDFKDLSINPEQIGEFYVRYSATFNNTPPPGY